MLALKTIGQIGWMKKAVLHIFSLLNPEKGKHIICIDKSAQFDPPCMNS